jgi:predicted nucleic acid-binding protein
VPAKPQRFGLDSSFVIALLCEWHVHHAGTLSVYLRLLDRGAIPVLPVHVILESYSVLTRLPAPYRLPCSAAKLVLEETFASVAEFVGLDPETTWKTIHSLARLDVGGGRTYDAVIASLAASAGATQLLTWNMKDFVGIAPASLEVQEPVSSSAH